MSPIHHRKPGLIVALLRHRSIYLELITDYINVSPETVLVTIDYTGLDQVALITDNIGATMLPDGKYKLGRLDVEVKDEIPRLSDPVSINLASSFTIGLAYSCLLVCFP